MRHIVYVLVILPLFSVINTVHATSQLVTDSAEALAPSSLPISEVRRERKERRLLRKKKQRMRELREEIRTLTWSLHQTNGGPVIGKTEMKHKQKGRHGRKGVKWRKNLLEKLKVIVRRLDRMERRIIGAKSILSPEFTINATISAEPSSPSTVPTTTDASINSKIKRIQPAITRSRSGENGTVCVAHKDCRPGHCCHHVVTKESASSVCVMHGFPENAYCIDGCQCSTQLSCFLPEGNATEAFCKKASSVDVLQGSYLYRQDSTIVDM